MEHDLILSNKLDLEWNMIDKILTFDKIYLYKQKWGTKKDWRYYLHYKNPDTKQVINFVDTLISLKILVYNGTLTKQKVDYTIYKLRDKYEKDFKEIFIETTPIYRIFSSCYTIYEQ